MTPAHDAQRGCSSILNAFYQYLVVRHNSSESVTNHPLELRGARASHDQEQIHGENDQKTIEKDNKERPAGD